MDQPEKPPKDGRRTQWRAALERDVSRHSRRTSGNGNFWRSLALVGSVGWPIAVAAVGGAWVGRLLDNAARSGIRFTALLLVVGAAAGSWIAWRMISERRP